MVKQVRAARTREALVRAAAAVFVEEGFVTASLAVISGRAGVSTGGLHFHFESKTALARAVEGRAAEALRLITVGRPSAVDGAGLAGGPDGAGGAGGAGQRGGALQLLVDSTHALMALLAQDVVVRAGFGLGADAGYGNGFDLRGQWRLWVGELLGAAEREGALAEGVSPQDAVSTVVASTVGLEVLGAVEPVWVAPQTLTRFWRLILPRLATGRVLGGLVAEGSAPGGGGGSDVLRADGLGAD
ncbi:TetR family transcriptional regulator [Streptomyces sp. NPDC051567]|uniref:TetR family transcriptional regulator n=1 Tax=Streptomyces sp. NPDC051567 TaxID=3365660 RepID=UPI0037B10788